MINPALKHSCQYNVSQPWHYRQHSNLSAEFRTQHCLKTIFSWFCVFVSAAAAFDKHLIGILFSGFIASEEKCPPVYLVLCDLCSPNSPIIIFQDQSFPEHETREPKVVTCDLSLTSALAGRKRGKYFRGVIITSKGALFYPSTINSTVETTVVSHPQTLVFISGGLRAQIKAWDKNLCFSLTFTNRPLFVNSLQYKP